MKKKEHKRTCIARIFKRSISIHVDCGSSMELVEMKNQPHHKELVTSEETTLMPLETGKLESYGNKGCRVFKGGSKSGQSFAQIF